MRPITHEQAQAVALGLRAGHCPLLVVTRTGVSLPVVMRIRHLVAVPFPPHGGRIPEEAIPTKEEPTTTPETTELPVDPFGRGLQTAYPCALCGAVFASRQALAGHQLRHAAQAGTASAPVEAPTPKTYSCADCGEVFTDPHAYAGHRQRHTRPRSTPRQAPQGMGGQPQLAPTAAEAPAPETLTESDALQRVRVSRAVAASVETPQGIEVGKSIEDVSKGPVQLPVNIVPNVIDVNIPRFDDSLAGWVRWYLDRWEEDGTDEIEHDLPVLQRLVEREQALRG